MLSALIATLCAIAIPALMLALVDHYAAKHAVNQDADDSDFAASLAEYFPAQHSPQIRREDEQ